PQDDGGSYSTLMVKGDEVAGIVPADEGDEAGWQIYFGVADLRKAVEAAVAAGGELLVEPEDKPEAGSLATIQDPQGGILSLIQT
ncbi:MAG: VOC family protein, partial [Paenarthrobacter sp.]